MTSEFTGTVSSYDELASRYDDTRRAQARGDQFASSLVRCLAEVPGPVLDLGCGTGAVAAALSASHHQVVAVDVAHEMCRRARGRHGEVINANAQELPFRSKSISSVCAVWMLNAVDSLPAAVREIARVLCPGGRLLVIPSLPECPSDQIGRLLWDCLSRISGPGGGANEPSTLRRTCSEAGLVWSANVPGTDVTFLQRPADIARALQAREYHFLWNLTEDRFERDVWPIIEQLDDLSKHCEWVERCSTFTIIVFTQPGRIKLTTHARDSCDPTVTEPRPGIF